MKLLPLPFDLPPALDLSPAPQSPAVAAAPPPPPRSAAQVKAPKALWYAVVFQELPAPDAPQLLQRLCLNAQRFTPLVSIELPNALLLEIKGSVKLFGSLPVLQTAIDAEWQRLALRAEAAVAPTSMAALWLARAGFKTCIEDLGALAGALAELPIACTAWDAEFLHTLRSMGVTRIGELLRLPRAGIARRLSPAVVQDLDQALARCQAPRRAFIPRTRFRERHDFETEIETVEYLQQAVAPLIARCARFLRERQAGVQGLELKLQHRQIAPSQVRVGLASTTSEAQRLADVLCEKLQRLELPAPVNRMELRSSWLQPLSADSLDAFAGLHGAGRNTAPQLVERLRARLGEAAVYGVCLIAEHRPEAAWRRVHELSLHAAVRTRAAEAATQDMPRPVWLLAEPQKLSAADLQLLEVGELHLEQGPERIESGWWDGHGVARDYYLARRIEGARWWIFQERQSKHWYLHGVFA